MAGTHFNYLQNQQVAASEIDDLYKKSTKKLNAYRAQLQKERHQESLALDDSRADGDQIHDFDQKGVFPPETTQTISSDRM